MARTSSSDHLLTHSVKRGDFVLRSGKQSNWFIDAKQTTCSPDGMLLVADAFLDVLPDDIDAVGGLTMGADAIAFSVAADRCDARSHAAQLQRAKGGQGSWRRWTHRGRAAGR